MALSYSKAYTTSMARRLDCTRDGAFNSMNFYREGSGESGGFTTSGDTSEANRFSTVTVKTPQVTVTGWSSSGGTKYRVYCTLHTPFGDYQTATTTLTWNSSTTTRTFTFTFEGVLGEWTSFKVWANQDTYTTTSGPYMYWFNNDSGTVTVTYAEGTASGDSASVAVVYKDDGSLSKGTAYVWKTTPTTYSYPEAAMTSNSSQGCVVSASSQYSTTYPPYKAFDKNPAGGGYQWATTSSDTANWIQLVMPQALYNIKVEIHNCNAKGPAAGIIYGSNDSGTTLTQIGSFSGRSTTSGYSDTTVCDNSTTAYNTVRVKLTQKASGQSNYDVGEIYITGTDISSSGGWVKATAYVYDGSNWH